jgi:hypothetical protein
MRPSWLSNLKLMQQNNKARDGGSKMVFYMSMVNVFHIRSHIIWSNQWNKISSIILDIQGNTLHGHLQGHLQGHPQGHLH